MRFVWTLYMWKLLTFVYVFGSSLLWVLRKIIGSSQWFKSQGLRFKTWGGVDLKISNQD